MCWEPVMITHPKTICERVERDMLQGRYESATFELERVQNALYLAQFRGDADYARQLALEVYDTAARLRSARLALERHRDAVLQAPCVAAV